MRREGLPALQLIVGDDSKWSIHLRQGDKVYSDEGRTPTDRVPPSSRLDNRPLRKKLVVAR